MAEESVSVRDVVLAVGRLEERLKDVSLSVGRLEERVQDVSLSMARVEERVQGLEKRLEEGFSFMRMTLDQVDKRIDDVQGEVRSMRTWNFGMYAPIVVGVVGVLVAYARSLW